MRILFGVLGLLIVVSIVLSVARKQLQAVSSLPTTPVLVDGAPAQAPAPSGERAGRLDAFPGAVAADPSGLTVPQQSQNLQNKVANDVNRIMQNAPSRAEGQ
ncbi:MAG TPA: hypothetical protein VLI72_11135 [Methylibium sp.]|nr:hypothetical protein [Methylibium sp.]